MFAMSNNPKTLWEHQDAAVSAVYESWIQNKAHVVIDVPTGAGKSLIQAHIIKQVCQMHSAARVIALAPSRELVEQNYHELIEYWPDAPAGIVCAGLGCFDLDAQIIFATPQTFINRVDKMPGRPADVVFCDEAHRVTVRKKEGDEAGVYLRCLEKMAERNNGLRSLGLTATPYRHMTGKIYGEDNYFSELAYQVKLDTLLDGGILAPLTVATTEIKIDTEIKKKDSYGDYNTEELAQKAMRITDLAVQAMIKQAGSRKKWLVFCCTIEHAKGVNAQLVLAGIPSAVLYTPSADETTEERHALHKARVQAVEDFRAGKIMCLVNVNILTTGFNVPDIDLLVMLRPTKSPVLYVQAAGRGMRSAPGKTDCLYLDFADNIEYHGPVDDLILHEKGEEEAPKKRCPKCKTLVPISARKCTGTIEEWKGEWKGEEEKWVACTYVFPREEQPENNPAPEINADASTLAVLSRDRTTAESHGLTPDGVYPAKIVDSERKTSKAGNQYLSVKINVDDGSYYGREVWEILNLWHPKDVVRFYAGKKLDQILSAVNKGERVGDTEELHHIPFRVKLGYENGANGYKAKNVVKKYLPAEVGAEVSVLR